VEKPGGLRPAKRPKQKINVRREGEATCIAKHDDEQIERPASSRVRVEASIVRMDQGEAPKFPLLVYAHPEYLIKPWPREALIVVWFPPLYEEQYHGRKQTNNRTNNLGLHAVFCSRRTNGEPIGFTESWEAAFVDPQGIARKDLEPETFSCESASTQRLAFRDATPSTPADTARSKNENARLTDRFVLDTTFNSSPHKNLELKRQ
jgi:hypothetical protein